MNTDCSRPLFYGWLSNLESEDDIDAPNEFSSLFFGELSISSYPYVMYHEKCSRPLFFGVVIDLGMNNIYTTNLTFSSPILRGVIDRELAQVANTNGYEFSSPILRGVIDAKTQTSRSKGCSRPLFFEVVIDPILL